LEDLYRDEVEGHAADAEGDLIATTECVQTIVADETKVAAFYVVDLPSPEPHLTATFEVNHEGKVSNFELETQRHRKAKAKAKGKGKGYSQVVAGVSAGL